VALSVHFRRADGTALSGQTVRVSDGENRMDYPLDEAGQLQIADLPRTGTYTIGVVEDGQAVGTMALELAVGSVIDAATDAEGVGHVTLREDTDTVSLDLVLDESGSLTCSLRLSDDDSRGASEV